MFHKLPHSLQKDKLPNKFTYPFCYTPNRICVELAAYVREQIKLHSDWNNEAKLGKMFGVMVVQDYNQNVGWIVAYSGNLGHSNNNYFFVPAIYDLLDKNGEFYKKEQQISLINTRIKELENCANFRQIINIEATKSADWNTKIEAYKNYIKASKAQRDAIRQNGNYNEQELIKESQFQKAELNRLKKEANKDLQPIRDAISKYTNEISQLKEERKLASEALQQRLFELYIVHNGKGETKNIGDIFKEYNGSIPPAATGECAAPKMLEYAYRNQLRPICMAEFWYGESPTDEIRIDGNFYPACRSKCLPLLTYMLQGIDVEPNPLEQEHNKKIELLYDDSYLSVIYKPNGMPSVPGKIKIESAIEQYNRLYNTKQENALCVHRLDMATSGVLLIAKDIIIYKQLQALFARRLVHKTYVAILDKPITNKEGTISLPLTANINDRPRQMVDPINGNEAITNYKVIEVGTNYTRIEFYPLTGRTHQLRVHAAHKLGLNAPIKGDTLYGNSTDRLYLHAEKISLTHPITGKTLTICKNSDF